MSTQPVNTAEIFELAREIASACLKRQKTLSWDEAVGAPGLVDAMCKALNARRVDGPEHKPHGRVAVTLQIDGYYKPLDLSILPIAAA